MVAGNPFTLSFGKVPNEYIPRLYQTDQIISAFDSDPSTDQFYVIVGVRGTGKTVQMNAIVDRYRKEKNWIVAKINPEDQILSSVYAELYHSNKLHSSVKKAKLSASVSAGPVKLEISNEDNGPQLSLTSKVSELLLIAAEQKKKILISIDEISNTPQMAEFASAMQIFISDHLPIYVLGTALYENLEELADKKNLSFLYRAPRVYLNPLDLEEISKAYQRTLQISRDLSITLAKLTKGYSFAFQALGFICWEHKNSINVKKLLPEYDSYLREYSYKKIWNELSENDKKVAAAVSMHEGNKVREIREACHMEPNEFSPYRARLYDKGLIDTSVYGRISFTLPRFSQFIQNQLDYEM